VLNRCYWITCKLVFTKTRTHGYPNSLSCEPSLSRRQSHCQARDLTSLDLCWPTSYCRAAQRRCRRSCQRRRRSQYHCSHYVYLTWAACNVVAAVVDQYHCSPRCSSPTTNQFIVTVNRCHSIITTRWPKTSEPRATLM